VASLERRLGLFSVITISISSMIGSGIFVLPGLGFEMTGPSIYLAFLLSAICILPAAISKAELATAMPTSGGTYIYLERTFGPLAGTVTGLGLFLSILLKAAFSLVGIKAYFSVLSTFDPMYTAFSFLIVILLVNVLGVGKVSSFLTVILFITVIGLGFLCIFAIPEWSWENAKPIMPNGFKGLASATALVFVSFAGVTKVAAIAEEVKNPERNLPRGIIFSLFLVTFIYCAVSLILAGVYNYQDLAGELKPIYKLAFDIGGPFIGATFAVIATLTMVNTSNAGILAASRFPFAMSRDNLLPSFLGKLHPKFLTPIVSIFLSGIIIATILLTLDVAKIAKLASAFMILIYILENISVIVLREARTQWYKPKYKSIMYPFLQIFGIVSGIALLFAMGKLALIAIISIGIPGILLYAFYSSKRTTRKGVIGIRGKRKDLIQEYPAEPGSFCSFDVQGDAQVVVGLFGREKSAEMLIEMGTAIAEHTNLEVAHIMELPEQTDLHDVLEEPGEMRSLRRRIVAMANEKNESITFDPVPSHDVSRTVFEISQGLHCQWLLIEWGGRSRGSFTFHYPIGWLKSHLHCNLATFRDAGVRYIRKIMILINEDKNDTLVLSTADHLAKVFWADITLVKFSNIKSGEVAHQEQGQILQTLGATMTAQTQTKVVTGHDQLKATVAETCEYDLLILGSSDHTLLNSMFGTFDDKLMAKASCSVLAVHAGSPNPVVV
jgi:amino acid transporter/nucleotide-binding universal stress UspA family protein